MNGPVCVDASFVLKLVVPEADSEAAEALWTRWARENRAVVAPLLLMYEVASALRKRVYREELSEENGRSALAAVRALGMHLAHADELHEEAWELALRFNQPVAYDAYYLAVAQRMGAELWTADRALFAAVQLEVPWIRYLGEAKETT